MTDEWINKKYEDSFTRNSKAGNEFDRKENISISTAEKDFLSVETSDEIMHKTVLSFLQGRIRLLLAPIVEITLNISRAHVVVEFGVLFLLCFYDY